MKKQDFLESTIGQMFFPYPDVTLDDTVARLIHATFLYKNFQQAEFRLNNQIKAIARILTNAHNKKLKDGGGQGIPDSQYLHASPNNNGRRGHKDLATLYADAPASNTVGEGGLISPVPLAGPAPQPDPFLAEQIFAATKPLIQAHQILHYQTECCRRAIEELAKLLPVAPWVLSIKGAGLLNLGLIVGAARTLSNYSSIGKLWKRLGLAVLDGERQRNFSGKTDEGKALNELHGFSGRRRAIVSNLGECLLKNNYTGTREDGYYRTVYVEQKEKEIVKAPDKWQEVWHRRAKRYMEKRFIKHLWQAWKRCERARREMSTCEGMPSHAPVLGEQPQ